MTKLDMKTFEIEVWTNEKRRLEQNLEHMLQKGPEPRERGEDLFAWMERIDKHRQFYIQRIELCALRLRQLQPEKCELPATTSTA